MEVESTRELRVLPLRHSVVEREHLVALAFGMEQLLQLLKSRGHLIGEVARLRPVVVGVVELPAVVDDRPRLAGHLPGHAVPSHRGPSFVVDPAVADHLEVLRTPLVLRIGVVERVPHRHALDRLLRHAVHRLGIGQSGHVEQRRQRGLRRRSPQLDRRRVRRLGQRPQGRLDHLDATGRLRIGHRGAGHLDDGLLAERVQLA
jgi:hypothetical protein